MMAPENISQFKVHIENCSVYNDDDMPSHFF